MPVSTLFVAGRQQFMDNGGKPLVGGNLYVGQADQDPKLTTIQVYADRGLTIPIPQPIGLDEYGRTIVPVWIGQSYSYLIETAGGIQYDSGQRVDVIDIEALIATEISELAASLDAGYFNLIVNGGMLVNTGDAAPSLTSSYQESEVRTVYGLATTVTAGTLQQGESATFGATARHLAFSGLSQSSTGAHIACQFRIPGEEAACLSSKEATFSVLSDHDVGSDINYRIIVSRANALNDFSALTVIDTSADQPVSSGVATPLSFTVADMGDCSNGVAITVQVFTGQVTSKIVRFADAQMEIGAIATAFQTLGFEAARAALDYQRFAKNYTDQRIEDFAQRDPASPWLNGIGAIATLTSGSGNWTVPAGVYRVKYTVTAPGGGGGGRGAGAANGSDATNTTFNSTIIAVGGKGGATTSIAGPVGGAATGGTVNIPGGGGEAGDGGSVGKSGGASFWGGGGGACGSASNGLAADAYGAGGGGAHGASAAACSGSAGGTCIGILSVTPGDLIPYVIGTVGAGGAGEQTGGDGADGIIVLEY